MVKSIDGIKVEWSESKNALNVKNIRAAFGEWPNNFKANYFKLVWINNWIAGTRNHAASLNAENWNIPKFVAI